MNRFAFKRATDNPDWTEDWTMQPDPKETLPYARTGTDRVEALRAFLVKERGKTKTETERQVIAGLILDLPRALKQIG